MNTVKQISNKATKLMVGVISWVIKRLLLVTALIAILFFAVKSFIPDWSALYRASRVIDVKDIVMQLEPIGEMATYEATYNLEYTDSSYRQANLLAFVFGEDFCYPGTERYIEADYNGRIKVGFRMSDIMISVDEETKTIFVTLPAPEILSHEILSVNIHDDKTRNNILNPIKADDVITAIEETKDAACEKAIAQYDVYTNAQEHAEVLIRSLLTVFDGYSIEITVANR